MRCGVGSWGSRFLRSRGLGAFVECGTYKGGSAAVLARDLGAGRHLWLYDSFEGVPETTPQTARRRANGSVGTSAAVADVEEIMARVATPRGQLHDPEGLVRRYVP